MVISLATSDCHSAADALTRSTAPVVIEARKVMMATTATSARPAIKGRGTIRDRLRARAGPRGRSPPGGDRGRKCHDGDHGDQRAAADRGARRDRRQVGDARRNLRALLPEIQE